MPRRAKRILKTACITAGVTYAAWALLLVVMQDRLVFPAGVAGSGTGAFAADIEVLTRELSPAEEGNGRVEAWLWKHPDATAESPRPLVVYFHGNAELIDYQAFHAGLYREMGYSVLLVEYRGYGRSAGKPSQTAIVTDAMHFLEQMVLREWIDWDRLVVHGRSIGGSVAVQVAGRLVERIQAPAALVLETSTPSVAGMAWRFGLPPFLVRHPFRSDQVLPGLEMPILVIAAEQDEVFPLHHSERLAELAPQATLVRLPGSHNTFIDEAGPGVYQSVLADFLGKAVGPADRQTPNAEPISQPD
ncbi:MAG: alpha/beta hydrolase [Planctomycetota bacterium]